MRFPNGPARPTSEPSFKLTETVMTPRLNLQDFPEALKPMFSLEAAIADSGLEPSLIDLVKTRASQINGCAYCIHMHTLDARTRGESEERLYLLDAWRESPLYTDRERAALAWRGPDASARDPRPRRRLRAPEGAFHAGGAGAADAADRRHQRLEPAGVRLPGRASGDDGIARLSGPPALRFRT